MTLAAATVDFDPLLRDEEAVEIRDVVLFGKGWADDNLDEMEVVIVGGLVCVALCPPVFW